jgi:hemoglobin-like flavoprotein
VEADFDTVGDVLLWTLGLCLGARFTPQVREAWAAVYAVLSEVMKQGLASAS